MAQAGLPPSRNAHAKINTRHSKSVIAVDHTKRAICEPMHRRREGAVKAEDDPAIQALLSGISRTKFR